MKTETDKQTVAEIVGEMRRDAVAADAWCETHGEMASAASVLNRHADRIEAAHMRDVAELKRELELTRQQRNRARLDAQEKFVREVAELREFSNDMRTWFRLYYSCGSDPKSKWWRSCASCRRKRCPIHKWRKALEGATK